MNVLVLNCGSSSIKYQLLDMAGEPTLLAKGLVEKIGLPVGSFTHKPEGKDKYVVEEPIADHTAGIDLILKALVDPKHGVIKALTDINAVGHRVAHGGEFFAKSARVDEDAKKKDRCLLRIGSTSQSRKLERNRDHGKTVTGYTTSSRIRHVIPSNSSERSIYLRAPVQILRGLSYPSLRIPRNLSQVRG